MYRSNSWLVESLGGFRYGGVPSKALAASATMECFRKRYGVCPLLWKNFFLYGYQLRHYPSLPPRANDSHKGDFGRALLIGGSRGMAGAIGIAGLATLRSGAGLVRLAVPDPILETVAAIHPCLMTISLPSDHRGRIARKATHRLASLSADATCVAIGPGLDRSPDLDRIVGQLYRACLRPMVVDADGLNALSRDRGCLPEAPGVRILTPHPGEFERLTGESNRDREQQTQAAVSLASTYRLIVVLKGYETIITDGKAVIKNQTGNPKMASGGSGDCLTGIITALVCQGMDPFEAAQLGVALHGKAGDLAAEKLACPSVLATDLIEALPEAFRQLA